MYDVKEDILVNESDDILNEVANYYAMINRSNSNESYQYKLYTRREAINSICDNVEYMKMLLNAGCLAEPAVASVSECIDFVGMSERAAEVVNKFFMPKTEENW